MFYYSFRHLYNSVRKYNKKNNTKLNVNYLIDPDFNNIKLARLNMDVIKIEEPRILYEDDNCYGIYKPAFWTVSTGSNDDDDVGNKRLLQVWASKNLKYDLSKDSERGYGICNRLDGMTSGIIIIAKNIKNYEHIRKVISNSNKTKKRHLCIVRGIIDTSGTISTSIDCIRSEKVSKCFNAYDGKNAKTSFRPIAYLRDSSNREYTLLYVRIYTGRTHQIRVHMRMLNTYIIGDDRYSDVDKSDDQPFELRNSLVPRMFLHAFSYQIPDINGKNIDIRCPVPIDLLNTFENNFFMDNQTFSKSEIMRFMKKPEKIPRIEEKKKRIVA